MDDLESAILLCFNPPADKALAEKALQYCQNVQKSPEAWAIALERLSTGTARPEVGFWCCQILQETFADRKRYPASFSPDQIRAIRERLLPYFSRVAVGEGGHANGMLPPFLLNKVAQLIVTLIAVDYPHAWPDAFRGFILPLVSTLQNLHPLSTAMFFRVLRALDEDVTSIRAAQLSDLNRATSIRVKDALRDDCISVIIAKCTDLLRIPNYVSHAFDVISRYVEWVDIGIIATEQTLQPMYAAITSSAQCDARPAAAAALRAIIAKRMDANAKINLLKALRVEQLLQSIPAEQIVANEEDSGDAEIPLQSGEVEVASLINTIAMAALDVLKEAMKEKKKFAISGDSQAFAATVAQLALPVALRLMDDNAEEGTSSQTLQCVSNYVNIFARVTKNGCTDGSAAGIPAISAILNVIEEKALLPTDFDPQQEKLEGHRSFQDLRLVLIKTIFPSVVRSFPAMCAQFVRNLCIKATESSDITRTELGLALLVQLTTSSSDVPAIVELRRAVIANPPSCMRFPSATLNPLSVAQQHQLELVSSTYFDLVARSYRLFLTKGDQNLLTSVLPVFFDERGLAHRASEAVKSNAAYSLLKLARPLRSVVTRAHLRDILKAASPHMMPIHEDASSQSSKNQMLLFETVGYLLGTDHKQETSMQFLRMILEPLMKGMNARPGAGAVAYISACGYLSKGFGGDSKPLLLITSENGDGKVTEQGQRTSPGRDEAAAKEVKLQRVTPLSHEMQSVWLSCLETVLKASASCLQVGKDVGLLGLRAKLIFFLHRMVDTVGGEVLRYLEQVLPEMLKSYESALELRDILILASQAVTKFGDSFESVAMRIYADIVRGAGRLPFKLEAQSLMAVSEESREAVEMHRAFTYFIHALVGCNLINVIVHERHKELVEPVMNSILCSAVGERLDIRVSASVMKMSLSTLRQMVVRWTKGGKNGTNTAGPGGFAEFVNQRISVTTVASGMCGTIFRSGLYDSGQAISVLTEIVNLQKTCANALGRCFGEALMAGQLRSLPKGAAEQYVSGLYVEKWGAAMLVPRLVEVLKLLQ